jgi:hypothetical protein
MGKLISDGFIDGGPDAIALSTEIYVTSAEPADYAGIAAVELADGVLDSGDFTIADGDSSGRKITVAEQADLAIDTGGTATHVVVSDGTDIMVTTCTSQALTGGGTVTIPAFKNEISDPS